MKKELIEYSEEQVQRIIGVFNVKVLRDFLQHNSKRYQKYYTGFRAEALRMNQLQDKFSYLILKVHDKMVISFIESYMDRWLSEIDAELTKRYLSNNVKNEVLADVLLDSVFSNDFVLYFDLERDEHSESEIMDVLTKVTFLTKARENDQKHKEEIATLKLEFEEKFRSDLAKVYDEQNKINREYQLKINQLIADIASLKKEKLIVNEMLNNSQNAEKRLNEELNESNLSISNLIADNKDKERLISTYTASLNEKIALVNKYSTDLDNLLNATQKNEYKNVIECDFAKVNKFKKMENVIEITSDCFKEELDQNLYNIGFESLDSLYLSELICNSIANNLPIFANAFLAESLTKCISATIDGGAYIKIVVTDETKFNTSFSNLVQSVPEKVVQIDCFLGKYDESNLLNLIRDCSELNKVFILSLTYDKQIKYMPVEMLNYTEYISLTADLINPKEGKLRYSHIGNLEIVSGNNATYRNKFSKIVARLKIDKNYISVREKGMITNKTICAYLALQLIPFLAINRSLTINELIDIIDDDSIVVELQKVLENG